MKEETKKVVKKTQKVPVVPTVEKSEKVAIIEPVVIKTMDLKESEEMLKALGLIVKALGKVLEDGKIGFDDATILLELAKEYEVIIEGFKGLSIIPAELKDLSESEMIRLVTQFYPILKDIKDIILKMRA